MVFDSNIMATFIATAHHESIIPMVSNVFSVTPTETTLTREVNEGTNNNPRYVKRKETGFLCRTNDIETLIKTILEFQDCCSAERLNVTRGPELFKFFRLCLGGTIRDTWDITKIHHQLTIPGFASALEDFLKAFLKPNDLFQQKKYLENFKKHGSLNVTNLSDRLKLMNRFMQFFPGSDNEMPYSDKEMKFLLYNMMPQNWQMDFAKSGIDLNEDLTSWITWYTTCWSKNNLPTSAMAIALIIVVVVVSILAVDVEEDVILSPDPVANRTNNNDDQSSNKLSKNHCRVHPNGYHTWEECSQNPKNQRDNGSRGGRGFGRGGRSDNRNHNGGGRNHRNDNNQNNNRNNNGGGRNQRNEDNHHNQNNNNNNDHQNNQNNNRQNNRQNNQNNNNNTTEDNHWLDGFGF